MKTLYFEGAGMHFNGDIQNVSDVGNYRIRTSFLNNDGVQIYIELGNGYVYDKKKVVRYSIAIQHLINVSLDRDENISHITFDWKDLRNNYNYTKADIIKWINQHLNCSFDNMEVLHEMEGYRVHAGNGLLNLMEHHDKNEPRTKARIEAFNKLDNEYKEICKSKYSVIQVLNAEGDKMKIRCHASDTALQGHPRIKEVQLSY